MTQEDLHQIEDLLVALRELPELHERKPGYFSRGSRAYLHFHEDGGEFYVDVRLDAKFERLRVSSREEQNDFLSRVRKSLRSRS